MTPQRKMDRVNGSGVSMTFQYGALKLRQGWLRSQARELSSLGD